MPERKKGSIEVAAMDSVCVKEEGGRERLLGTILHSIGSSLPGYKISTQALSTRLVHLFGVVMPFCLPAHTRLLGGGEGLEWRSGGAWNNGTAPTARS